MSILDGVPPTSEHRRLVMALTGEWRSEEQVALHPGAALDQPRRGRLVARSTLGGCFVISDYVQERDGAAVFAGHGIYGWDGARYTMQWFDSEANIGGDVVPGTWIGETLCFTRTGTGPRGRYEYTFNGDGSYTLRILVGDDATNWMPVLVGKFSRVSTGAAPPSG